MNPEYWHFRENPRIDGTEFNTTTATTVDYQQNLQPLNITITSSSSSSSTFVLSPLPDCSSCSSSSSSESDDSIQPEFDRKQKHQWSENSGSKRRAKRKGGIYQQVHQRHAANLRERKRMQSINDAFEVSENTIPKNPKQNPCLLRVFDPGFQLYRTRNDSRKWTLFVLQ